MASEDDNSLHELQHLRMDLQHLTENGTEDNAVVSRAQSWSALRLALADWVNGLIQQDMQELIRVLYRIDISEPKLKYLLKEKVGEDASLIIADLIIERQLQKIKTRQQFKQAPPENEADRW
ncbi:hypothetical protein [Flavihumibacter sp. CACIAM 22H1]|uniref:hypothetical protein n=1 Tax=Flavihumibacter sp. CACIAM 22H1 TaxID=1812911 RepID=UPI0007A91A7F|nr:hypothetical protein [Flavihumibacter sp. CACIAM 22H1]KYP15391.1 MAG: hypothetical protein A1D16_16540 [Flavihumibacter sp. CACIAM 22H1]